MKRRDFLRTSGWFVVGAALTSFPACGSPGDNDEYVEPSGTFFFPQGVASGDPSPSSVVLWTRARRGVERDRDTSAVDVLVEVSTDSTFATTVVRESVQATSDSDHTVRVLVNGLSAGTEYYYRFTAGRDSIVGRTRTAPEATADVQVNLAWISCQDYVAGYYGGFRQMILDDDARPAADKIHFVMHLGDVIYETRDDGFQTAIDDNFLPISLPHPSGGYRSVQAFPSGEESRFAKTLDDYRHLYRTYLSDPDFQEVRARWPMVQVWDDHEFTNDCWQSQSNYTSATGNDEASQKRKVAANQAWFEYVPAHLTGQTGVAGVASEAKDFAFAAVNDATFTAPNADNFVDEPNNRAAVNSIAIYRSLRFGKHVEVVMTDQRSYRSDHAIPEELTNNALFFDARGALPLPVVNIFDQGNTANGGSPPASVLGLPNVRAASPPGTMLGAKQKTWWKATMKGSTATWKVWGNEVPLARMAVQQFTGQPFDRVVTGDAWDGYPTERAELMTYLRTENIKNVVVLTGDIHAAFASTIVDNVDAPIANRNTVACELIAPGISSNSLFSFFEGASRLVPAALRSLMVVDASASGGSKFVENMNLWLLKGTNSAGTYAATKNVDAALAAADPTVNPHLKYADCNCQGYGYVKFTPTQVEATITVINRPIKQHDATGPGIKRTAKFVIPKDNPAGMTGPDFTGTKPFPFTGRPNNT